MSSVIANYEFTNAVDNTGYYGWLTGSVTGIANGAIQHDGTGFGDGGTTLLIPPNAQYAEFTFYQNGGQGGVNSWCRITTCGTNGGQVFDNNGIGFIIRANGSMEALGVTSGSFAAYIMPGATTVDRPITVGVHWRFNSASGSSGATADVYVDRSRIGSAVASFNRQGDYLRWGAYPGGNIGYLGSVLVATGPPPFATAPRRMGRR